MRTFRITLFGKFHIENDRAVSINIQGRKAQELLCYLLVFRKYPHPREKLASLLWEENSFEQSKSYLRRTLWQLQQAIKAHAEPWPPLLLVETEWIQLNPEASLWLDIAEMENVYRQVRCIPGELLDGNSAVLIRESTQLYQGNLLEGWHQAWCTGERERLRHIYLVMLEKLMQFCEIYEDIEAGIACGRRILSCDQTREHTHRQLMRLLYLSGDRIGAIRQYEYCKTALKEELGVEPTQRTKKLKQQIRQDKVDLTSPELDNLKYYTGTDQALLQQALVELSQIQTELECLNQRVSRTSDIFTNLLPPDDKE